MDYVDLYNFLQTLCYGTRLHVGVIPLGKYGNKKLTLPHEQTIHASAVCETMKGVSLQSYEKCVRCRNAAIKKAITDKKPFGGFCVNGIYEYMYPVIEGDTVLCIIYIGNILHHGRNASKLCRRLMEKAYLAETMERDFNEKQCESMAWVIESYICLLSEKYTDETNVNSKTQLIENAKRYVRSNLSYDISAASLAALFHYNEKYMGRLFKESTGNSFCQYVNEKRIEHAKQLLLETDLTIIEISEHVGFNNVTYFNRIFKNKCGMSPSLYRKKFEKIQ